MNDDTTSDELSPQPGERGILRAFKVATVGCAVMVIGSLTLLVAGFVLPDDSVAQKVVASGALWIVAGGVVVTAAATLYLFAQFVWTLVRAGRPT